MSFPTPYSHHYDHYATTPETTTTTKHARLFVCSPEHLLTTAVKTRFLNIHCVICMCRSMYMCVYRYSRSLLHSSKAPQRALNRPCVTTHNTCPEKLPSIPTPTSTNEDLQLQNISTIYPAMRRECPRRCAADFSSGKHIYTKGEHSLV